MTTIDPASYQPLYDYWSQMLQVQVDCVSFLAGLTVALIIAATWKS